MPVLEITTNVKVADEKAFTSALAKEGINVLGVDGKYWTVIYNYNEGLLFGGSHEPAFYMTIVNILSPPNSKNAGYCEKLYAFVEAKLGIPHDRGYIVFSDPGPDRLGFRSTTYDVLLRQMGRL